MGLPPGGGIIVHGQSGTGKSALSTAVANAFRVGSMPTLLDTGVADDDADDEGAHGVVCRHVCTGSHADIESKPD
jgi:hypothetical protein